MERIRLDLKDRLARGVTRAGKFFGPDLSDQIVKFGKLDSSMFRDQVERWPKFHQLIERGQETFPVFESFLTDLFFDLYLLNPQYRDEGEIKASCRINRELLDQTHGTTMFAEARSRSALNRTATMLGLVYVAQTLLDELPEEAKESVRQAIQNMAEQDQQQQAADQAIAMAGASLDAGDDQGAQQAIETLEAILDAAAAGQQQSSIDGDKARRMMKKAIDKANDEMEELEKAIVTWGADPGEFKQMDVGQAMELYEKMRKLPNVKQFTDELGRMRSDCLTASRQIHATEAHEIVDVTSGHSWNELLPNERVAIVDPDLELVLWAKIAQDNALSWAYAGKEQASKGPFIVLLDVSGSTHGAPERWGKGFMLAAVDMAARQDRDVAVVFFDAEVKPEGVFTFPRGKASLADKIQMAGYFTGGGTNWVEPLRIAIENIEASTHSWHEADVVLVTDGEYRVPPEFAAEYRARCEAKGVRTHGVLLDGTERMLESLKPVCDQVVSVQALSGRDEAKRLFNRFVGVHI